MLTVNKHATRVVPLGNGNDPGYQGVQPVRWTRGVSVAPRYRQSPTAYVHFGVCRVLRDIGYDAQPLDVRPNRPCVWFCSRSSSASGYIEIIRDPEGAPEIHAEYMSLRELDSLFRRGKIRRISREVG